MMDAVKVSMLILTGPSAVFVAIGHDVLLTWMRVLEGVERRTYHLANSFLSEMSQRMLIDSYISLLLVECYRVPSCHPSCLMYAQCHGASLQDALAWQASSMWLMLISPLSKPRCCGPLVFSVPDRGRNIEGSKLI